MQNPAPVTYPVHRLLRERWSPRSFSDEPVAPDVLRSLLEAARWAPSSMNEQPWRFLIGVKHTDPEGHARIADCLTDSNRVWASKAPVLMISVASTELARNGQPNRFAMHDVGLAVTQMIAQATASGLVVHPMGGFSGERARANLDIPDDFEPVAAIAIGHLASPDLLPDKLRERELAARTRNPHDAFAFGAKWGLPLKTAADYERLLQFWFGQLDIDGLADDVHVTRWWAKNPDFDVELRETFGAEHRALAEGKREAWRKTPRGRLAYVILLDQLSRNMFRDTPEMFAFDAKALEAAKVGIERGEDRELLTDERVFLYMPLMHSENLTDQKRCVELFRQLESELEGPAKMRIANNLEFAIRHRDIIAQFGRFPHRNAVLGRESTPEELAFLEQPNSSF